MAKQRRSRKAKGGANELRVIGGRWRGRRLPFPDVPGLRPTGNRLRETLFNWLGPDLTDSRCLDAFAGSGALGFEALSRGAAEVVLLETDGDACAQLMRSRENLDAAGARIERADVRQWLETRDAAPFDIVFLDPPFGTDLLDSVCEQLNRSNWLRPGSRVYIETGADTLFSAPPGWVLYRDRTAGDVHCRLYQIEHAE